MTYIPAHRRLRERERERMKAKRKMSPHLNLMIYFLLQLFLVLELCEGQGTTPPSEVAALNAMLGRWGKTTTETTTPAWNISGEPCSGAATDSTVFDNAGFNPAIKCDCSYDNATTCHITHFKVSVLDVVGRIPDELQNLTYLTSLDFQRNYLTGPLPAFIGNLTNLQYFNITGHVIHLDLRNRHKDSLSFDCASGYRWPDYDPGCEWRLRGEISGSLLSLGHLRHLDLSANSFRGKPIPRFFGSLRSLTYLNLSGADFSGRVPDQLGNLSRLHHLDLSYNGYYDDDDVTLSGILYLKDAGWISRLTSLRHLKMNLVSFANASDWLEALNALPRIQVLEVSDCELVHFPRSLSHVNFTSLTTLDLSQNYDINFTIPEWLFNITTLEHLDLRWTRFNWHGVPISIAKLTSLRTLDLSRNLFQNATKTAEVLSSLCNLQSLTLQGVPLNDELMNLQGIFSNSCLMFSLKKLDLSYTNLHGFLPDWLGSMKNLKYLDLSGNSLFGSLSTSLGRLSLLQYMSLSGNCLNGTIPEGMFIYMKELMQLDISYNSLILSEEHLTNLSSLKELSISWNTVVLNESFEDWIPPFQLSWLDMSSCEILPKPQIPKWIWTQKALLELDISSAGIQGKIPNWLPTSLQYLFLSDNQIIGYLPYYLTNINWLDLSNNSLSGQISSTIDKIMPNISRLNLAMNNLSGSITSSFCKLKFLTFFRISKNKLLGSLPNCWKNSSYLEIIGFSHNKLQGKIPKSLCNLQMLEILELSNNNLSGQIPRCLKYCTRLFILDLSHNCFIGNLPTWVGESLSQLIRLDLRSNSFNGSIPFQLSTLAHLQILDLSNNNLSGIIPSSFGNFTTMKDSTLYIARDDEDDDMWLFIKGTEFEYSSSSLWYIKFIDLSNNRLTGHIPKELGNLYELQSINLSKNCLVGEIPSNVKRLKKLEVLDLSRNNLFGVIPSDLAALTFLNHLNLSYNNLFGEIPGGPQLQTFDSSSYIGNPNLCGFPLLKNCINHTAKGDEEEQGEDIKHRIEIIYLYASIALGFIVGFWIICGTLLLKRTWRYVCFRYIDNTYDKIYVMVAVKLANFRTEYGHIVYLIT